MEAIFSDDFFELDLLAFLAMEIFPCGMSFSRAYYLVFSGCAMRVLNA
jgi:hypothetical protein